jgi:hypothetical protein
LPNRQSIRKPKRALLLLLELKTTKTSAFQSPQSFATR